MILPHKKFVGWLLVFMLGPFLFTACRDAGTAEAERDIKGGILRLKTYGLQSDVDKEYAALLLERCRVEVEHLATRLTPAEAKIIASYNRRMEQEIERQHGAGILTKLHQEALARVTTKKGQTSFSQNTPSPEEQEGI